MARRAKRSAKRPGEDGLMRRGTSTLLAATAAAIALPIVSLELNLPWWLACFAAAGVFSGFWLLGPSQARGGLTDRAVLEVRGETARTLALEAADAVARLKKAGRWIKDARMRAEVVRLGQIGDRILNEVRDDPNRVMAARRLLTFYLPNAASVAEGWRTLESRAAPSPERIAQTREVMQGLSQAFAKYADAVTEPELQALDIDLKVLKDALKSDLTETP
jgi:5-bromo-4-chloroindolyl phosphate hydrolysis protein